MPYPFNHINAVLNAKCLPPGFEFVSQAFYYGSNHFIKNVTIYVHEVNNDSEYSKKKCSMYG